MKNYSIWKEHSKDKPCPSLNRNLDVDVLIVGGGITGLSAAFYLKDTNLKVCLVDKQNIGNGVSSRTTGKLTYLQENIYTKLAKSYNEETAKLYLDSQKEAINLVKDIINQYKINCNLTKVDSYLIANNDNQVRKIKKEQKLLEKMGINFEEINNIPNNYPILYGIKVHDTYIFHPLKYLYGLKNIIKDKISIYENTKVEEIKKEKNYYICLTENYQIKTKKIILAMHYPYFLVPYLMPIKCHLEKSYIGAYKTDCKLDYSVINVSYPTISLRNYKNTLNNYEIFLNGSHNIAFKNNEPDNFKNLIDNSLNKLEYVWSNKDIITNDNLPFIGYLNHPGLLIGTGYNTWGMTNGSLAGKILTDIILEKDNSYINLFNPKRSLKIPMLINIPLDIFYNAKSFIGNMISKNKIWYKENVIFKKLNGKKVAIYIDDNGLEHIVYQKCPHLKCTLIFNEKEKTWDCPCHGSRFDISGKCIEGPSNYDIGYKTSDN